MKGGGGQIYTGGFDLLILPVYLIICPDFFENSTRKINNFVSKGGSSSKSEPPLDPPLTCILKVWK